MRDLSVALLEAASKEELEPTSRVIRREPLPLGMGKREAIGANPVVALLLAIVVGLVVFAIIWKIRRTFGMKG